jgi:molybdopterin-binding protein
MQMPSRISARNQLKGKVTKVQKDPVMTSVEVEVATPLKITSVITSNSAEDLNLKVGDSVTAIIKSTEIMIGKE